MMNLIKQFFFSTFKSFYWLFLMCLVGLLYSGISFSWNMANVEGVKTIHEQVAITPENTLEEEIFTDFIDQLLKSGTLLFFIVALVASVSIDYHFSSLSKRLHRFFSGPIFVVTPIALIFGCSILYLTFFERGIAQFGTEALKTDVTNIFINFENMIIFATICYTFGAKFIYFFLSYYYNLED